MQAEEEFAVPAAGLTVGVVFAREGNVLLVANSRSFRDPHWWVPCTDHLAGERHTEAATRLCTEAGAPSDDTLTQLGTVDFVEASGFRRRCAVFLQVVPNQMAVNVTTRYDGTLWRSLMGGPPCPELDDLLDQSLRNQHAFVPELVSMAAVAFREDDDAAVRLVEAGTDGRDDLWWAALAASVAGRAAFQLDMQATLGGAPPRLAQRRPVSVPAYPLSTVAHCGSDLPTSVLAKERP